MCAPSPSAAAPNGARSWAQRSPLYPRERARSRAYITLRALSRFANLGSPQPLGGSMIAVLFCVTFALVALVGAYVILWDVFAR